MSQVINGEKTDVDNVIEADLATIAGHASTELMGIINGQETRVAAISKLVEVIAESHLTSDDQGARFFLTSDNAYLVNRAMTPSYAPKLIEKASDFVTVAGEVESEFREFLGDIDKFRTNHYDKLSRMKSFAVALSRYACAEKLALYNQHSRSPYWI